MTRKTSKLWELLHRTQQATAVKRIPICMMNSKRNLVEPGRLSTMTSNKIGNKQFCCCHKIRGCWKDRRKLWIFSRGNRCVPGIKADNSNALETYRCPKYLRENIFECYFGRHEKIVAVRFQFSSGHQNIILPWLCWFQMSNSQSVRKLNFFEIKVPIS